MRSKTYFRAFKAHVCFKKTSTGHIAKSTAEEKEKRIYSDQRVRIPELFCRGLIHCAISSAGFVDGRVSSMQRVRDLNP